MTSSDSSNPIITNRSGHKPLNQSGFTNSRSGLDWLKTSGVGLAIALPIVFYFVVWSQYAVNIPKWDDHALRYFLFLTGQETTFSGKIHQLFKQHNEHRIVYDRIITTLDYWLFGKLNYKHLMVVGNLSLVGLLVVFIGVLRQAKRSLHYAVPVALFLFNLSQWENMFWGMAALQNFSVVLWVISAFYLLSYTDRVGLAITAAILATLTSGNGLLVWPLGFGLLLLQPRTFKPSLASRLFQPIVQWLISALLVVGLYFYGFEKPGDINYVRPGIFELIKGWFAVVGASAEALPIGRALYNCMLVGALLASITLTAMAWEILSNWATLNRLVSQWFGRKSSISKSPLPAITLFFWASSIFFLGTAAIVAYARTGFGAELLITSRYKIYSLALLALLYTYGIAVIGHRFGNWLGTIGYVAGFALAWLSYYSFLNETIWWRDWFLTNQFNWTYSTNRPVVRLDSVTQRFSQPEPAFYDQTVSTLYTGTQQQPVDLSVTANATSFSVTNKLSVPQDFRNGGNYILARSSKRLYLFPVWQNQRSPIESRLIPSQSFTTGFKADIPKADLEAGTYQLYVLSIKGDGQPTVLPTDQTIVSEGQSVDTTKKNW